MDKKATPYGFECCGIDYVSCPLMEDNIVAIYHKSDIGLAVGNADAIYERYDERHVTPDDYKPCDGYVHVNMPQGAGVLGDIIVLEV